MSFTMDHAPDLHPLRPRMTASGKGTRQFHQQEDTLHDYNRGLMLSVLFQAAMDYHLAKKLIRDRHIKTVGDYKDSPEGVRKIIKAGKAAWEWFTRPEIKGIKGRYSFAQICQYFNVNPKRMWAKLKEEKRISKVLADLRTAEGLTQ